MSSGSQIGGLIGIVLGVAAVLLSPATFGASAVTYGVLMTAATVGATVGTLAGSIYDYATQEAIRNESETLNQIFGQTSSLSVPLPQIFGHERIPGNVLRIENRFVVEHEEGTGGGKGGGGSNPQVTKTYDVDLMIVLSDTRLPGPVKGFRRIWRDGNIWYDMTSRKYDELPPRLVFYPGDAIQDPSPMLEAIDGVGNVPGYPYTCYVTLERYDLGNYPRIPIFTFELYQETAPMAALHQIARRASDGSIWAAAPGVNQVLVFDDATQDQTHAVSVERRLPIDPSTASAPFATRRGFPLGWDATEAALWIAHPHHYQLKRINANTKALTHCFNIDYSLLSGGVAHDGDMWFCAYHYGTKIGYVLRANTSGVTVITVGQARGGHLMLATLATGAVWVTDNHYPDGGGNSNLLRINITTNTVTETVVLGAASASKPIDLVVTPSDNHRWVLDAQANAVLRVDNTPAVAATIALSATPLQLAVASDGYVWACTTASGGTVYRINPATNVATAFDSLPLSMYSPAHRLMTPGNAGSMWVLSMPTWTTQRFATDGSSAAYSTGGAPRSQVAESTTHVWTGATRGELQRIGDDGLTAQSSSLSIPRLKGIIQATCVAVGFAPSDIDMSEIRNPFVAMKVTTVLSARTFLESIMAAHQVYSIESGLGLKFRSRAPSAVVASIPEEALDAYDASGDPPEMSVGLEIPGRIQPERLPKEFRLSWVSRARNYQQTTHIAYVNSSRAAQNVNRSMSVPLVLTDREGRQLAQELLDQAWLQRTPYRFVVNRDYAHLEPGDAVIVTARGISHSIILKEITYREPGLCECVGSGDIRDVALQEASFKGLGFARNGVRSEAATTAVLMNFPVLHSGDTSPRYHAGFDYAPTFWPGAVLYRSVDAGVSYTLAHSSTEGRAIVGTTTVALTNTTNVYTFDESSTCTVQLTSAVPTLGSVADTQLFAGANVAMIGSELVQFGVATLTGVQTYTLSHFLRGRQGTEWATSTHSVSETCVVLTGAMHAIAIAQSERNVARQYKAVTANAVIDTVAPVTFTATSENLTPWTVAYPLATRIGNDWLMEWWARSRFSGAWSDGEAFGYGPDFLGFRIRIYTDDTFTTMIRAIVVSPALDPEDRQGVTYTEAQQITDFGMAQMALYYRVYQVGSYGLSRAVNLTAT